MRRVDREMPKEFALEVLDKCEFAIISMVDKDKPYCVPISIARNENVIYFHSAKNGRKVQILKVNPKVCVSAVGDTKRAKDKFTTEYESAIIEGLASEVTDDEEKILVLRLISERHTPENMINFKEAISKSLFRTAVWKIEMETISGKRKKYDSEDKEMKYGRME
ncbi:MAG: 5-nitroimidazole antibiotic resistance protein [Clostridiales bacterium]|nr:5-nitroimidazole antibiotic resistance protein [Clostridiales bacterium]